MIATVDEYAHLLYMRGQLRHDFARNFGLNVPRTLFVEHETQRLGAGFDRDLRVLQIRDTADFYPGHEVSLEFDCDKTRR
jgi:hypothetical protein